MPSKKQPKQPKQLETLKLSLACGGNKPEGFKGVDIVKTHATDYVFDILKFPWRDIGDESVDEIECSNFVEHIPHGDSRHDPFFQFFDEIYRVLKPAEFDPVNPNIPTKGFARIVCPYYSSIRAWQDPTHQRAISEMSFLYLNKEWRKNNQLDHYPISCDFDFYYGYVITPEWQNRSQEAQQFAIQHYINVVTDISVQLVKRPAAAH
jgi:hypothetical protein